MKRGFLFLLSAFLFLVGNTPAQAVESLTMEQAVAIALARNHDVLAAKLNIDAALYDRIQAGLYPNPVFSYTLGNLILGSANPQGDPPIAQPGFFGQTQHTLSISEIIDVWAKRNTRMRTSDKTIDLTKLRVQDALREIVYNVRSAFADLVREQSELELSRETRTRYDQTVRISRVRFTSGEISEADFKKVELEGMRYQSAEIDAEMQLDLARQKLAALLALRSEKDLPGQPLAVEQRQLHLELEPLCDRAIHDRPDVQAAVQAKEVSLFALEQAQREALPDLSFSISYTHSNFQVSGDNPNSLGLGLSLPLPIFDHNQANIGRAKLDGRRADNEAQRLYVQVRSEVAGAVRRVTRAEKLLAVQEGGMLERAETALRVAERSHRAGAISLLELLEAQRTYLETRAQYVRTKHDYRQAIIDVMHAIHGEIK